MILDSLLKTNTASGSTEKVCEIIEKDLKSVADDIYTDNLGNLIVRIGDENAPTTAVFAPCDKPALVVTHIEENGYVRVHPLGSVDFRSCIYSHVTTGEVFGILYPDSKDADKFSCAYADFGFKSADEALLHINQGDTLFFEKAPISLQNGFVSGTGASSLSCADICFTVAKNIAKEKNRCFYFVFISQDNLQHRGASVAAFKTKPDVAVCLEAYEGKNICIKVADKSFVADAKITEKLIECAEICNIKLQKYVCPEEHGYASRIQSAGTSIKTASLLLPVRHHTTLCETVDKTDIDAISKITIQFLNNI